VRINYEFIAENTVDSVIAQLRKYGIACIPNYLTAEILDSLNAEFPSILSEKSPSLLSQTKHPINKDGRVSRFNPWHERSTDFPTISKVFQDEFMRSVSEAYFSPHDIDFNDEVFITHELPSPVPSLPWHFDRIQALKFWFNLTDTTVKDGAFEYCPGTQWEGRYRAGYFLSQGYGVKDIPNDIDPDLIRNPVTLELNAGDLLIFDPDGFHRSSRVYEGGEQRVLRAHTHPKNGRRYQDKKFSAGWWLQTALNLNKWVSHASSRTLGDKIQDTTINRQMNAAAKKSMDH